MLMIFIDSNIFFNNWYLRNANFAVLANYLSNEGGVLLVSDVVRQEVEAKFNLERDTLQKSLTKDLRRVADFQQEAVPFVSPSFGGTLDFIRVLNGRFDSVELIGLDDVSNRDLVPRAISARRPFRDGEKGYRDSVIWLSLILHLKKMRAHSLKLVFINANSHDFFDKATSGVSLHPHLKDDLSEHDVRVEIVPYTSLKDFIGSEIDLGLHSVKHEQFEDEHADEMEELASRAAERYLQDMSLSEMQDFVDAGGVPRSLARQIRSFSVEDNEGVEDPSVTSLSGLKDGSLYIGYSFNLLTVLYTVVVDLDDYLAHREEFEEYFLNMTIEDRSVTLELYRRCDFEASLAYRQDLTEFTSVSIDSASLRSQSKYRWRSS